jgi:hypothetical protein
MMSLSVNNLRRAAMLAVLAGAVSTGSAFAQDGGPSPNGNSGFTGQGMPQGMNPILAGQGIPPNAANFGGPNGANVGGQPGGNILEQAWNAAARTAAMARQMGGPNQGGPNQAGLGQSFAPGMNSANGMNPQMNQQMLAQRSGQGPAMRQSQGNQFAQAGGQAGFNPNVQGGNPEMAARMGGMPNNGMPNSAGRGRMNPSMQGLPNQGIPNQGMQRQLAGGEMGVDGRSGQQGGAMNYRAARPMEQGQVDLVLEDIELAGEATVVAGPAYVVRFRNQGLQAAGKFSVLLAASLDSHLAQDAPKTVIEVPGLEPGKGIELTLRLPMTALRMGEGKVPFSHLIVMVDATNLIEESDKSNNGAVLERGELEAPAANAEGKTAQ